MYTLCSTVWARSVVGHHLVSSASEVLHLLYCEYKCNATLVAAAVTSDHLLIDTQVRTQCRWDKCFPNLIYFSLKSLSITMQCKLQVCLHCGHLRLPLDWHSECTVQIRQVSNAVTDHLNQYLRFRQANFSADHKFIPLDGQQYSSHVLS